MRASWRLARLHSSSAAAPWQFTWMWCSFGARRLAAPARGKGGASDARQLEAGASQSSSAAALWLSTSMWCSLSAIACRPGTWPGRCFRCVPAGSWRVFKQHGCRALAVHMDVVLLERDGSPPRHVASAVLLMRASWRLARLVSAAAPWLSTWMWCSLLRDASPPRHVAGAVLLVRQLEAGASSSSSAAAL